MDNNKFFSFFIIKIDLLNVTATSCMFSVLLIAGVAGMCSKTAVAPLDRIKILLQAHNSHYKNLGQ